MSDTACPVRRNDAGVSLHEPLPRFRGSHDTILGGLEGLRELPGLAEALARARATAQAVLALFEQQVVSHHVDEEEDLFTAVLRSARGTADEARADVLVSRLTSEHRAIERMWSALRPVVGAVAAGKVRPAPGFAGDVAELVDLYHAHARLEEEVFLPLADRILARDPNHLAALDLSLHLRHVPMPRLAYC